MPIISNIQSYIGDTTPIVRVKIVGQQASTCSAKMALYTEDLSAPAVIAARNVPDKATIGGKEYFVAFFSSVETKNLAPGTYIMVIEVICAVSTPPQTKEVHFYLTLEQQGIA